MIEVPLPQHHSTSSRRGLLSSFVIFVAIAAFLFSICAIFIGFHHSLFDFHAFRQTQTAITAEYMEHGGAFFHYQTPIVGPPWLVPFELPLYQKIVAVITEHFHTPLQETGRAVSIAFFYLCFLPLASTLKRLRYSSIQILTILSLLAVSPLYIFVSRLFMMESTALFFSLMYVDQVFRLTTTKASWQYSNMIFAGIFGVLAGTIKVTTFTPYLLLAAGLIAWHGWKLHKRRALTASTAVGAMSLCIVLPVLCTSLWTRFADAQKLKNPIAALITSKKMLLWTFGTPAQRLHFANYLVFVHRVPHQAGSLSLLLLLVVVYAVLVRKWNVAALISLALYIITPMIYFNLHYVHEYYPYASAIFLVLGAGFLIADLLKLPGNKAWLGLACYVTLLAMFIVRYQGSFYPLQRGDAPGRAEAAAMIDRTTTPDDVIVISGIGLTSELAYQSHRRSIMDSAGPVVDLGPVGPVILSQHADTIPEYVACDGARGTVRVQSLLHFLAIRPATVMHADDCDIYLRSSKPSAR